MLPTTPEYAPSDQPVIMPWWDQWERVREKLHQYRYRLQDWTQALEHPERLVEREQLLVEKRELEARIYIMERWVQHAVLGNEIPRKGLKNAIQESIPDIAPQQIDRAIRYVELLIKGEPPAMEVHDPKNEAA